MLAANKVSFCLKGWGSLFLIFNSTLLRPFSIVPPSGPEFFAMKDLFINLSYLQLHMGLRTNALMTSRFPSCCPKRQRLVSRALLCARSAFHAWLFLHGIALETKRHSSIQSISAFSSQEKSCLVVFRILASDDRLATFRSRWGTAAYTVAQIPLRQSGVMLKVTQKRNEPLWL